MDAPYIHDTVKTQRRSKFNGQKLLSDGRLSMNISRGANLFLCHGSLFFSLSACFNEMPGSRAGICEYGRVLVSTKEGLSMNARLVQRR